MSKEANNKRKQEKSKKVKKKSGILKKILIFLIVLLILIAGFIAYKTQKNGGGMQGLLSTLVGHNEETLKNLKPLQILLMGVSTDLDTKLTDTIIVGTYDPQTQKASLLSIPRDTFVGKNIKTGTGSDKINALYQKSPTKTLEKVNEITGLDIKYYMVIDNQALIKLVDIIGGVEFYVPDNMNYDDPTQNLHIHLKKGLQVLDGDKAEQLVRFRKNNNGTTYSGEHEKDDFGRMETQRDFIIETAKQTIQAKNIFKVKEIIDLMYEYVETNISISAIKDYVPYAVNLDMSSIQTATLPGEAVGPDRGYPLWFFEVDKSKLKELIDELYNTTEEDESNTSNTTSNTSKDNTTTNTTTSNSSSENSSSSTTISKTEAAKVKIEILNGSGSSKALTEIKEALTKKGYKISRATNTTATSKTTIINKTGVDSKFEKDIKEILSVGNISTSSVSSSNVDITIIIGNDYK